jgi:hypothetical protein
MSSPFMSSFGVMNLCTAPSRQRIVCGCVAMHRDVSCTVESETTIGSGGALPMTDLMDYPGRRQVQRIEQSGQVVLMDPSSKHGDEDEMMLVFKIGSQRALDTSFPFTIVGNIVGGTRIMSIQSGNFGSPGTRQSPFSLETICRFNQQSV